MFGCRGIESWSRNSLWKWTKLKYLNGEICYRPSWPYESRLDITIILRAGLSSIPGYFKLRFKISSRHLGLLYKISTLSWFIKFLHSSIFSSKNNLSASSPAVRDWIKKASALLRKRLIHLKGYEYISWTHQHNVIWEWFASHREKTVHSKTQIPHHYALDER